MKMLLLSLLLVAQAASPRQSFEEQLAVVKASPGEARWDEIPWTTSLWEGRKRAAAEGKPLFIWAANGNPIGVT
jgi:hypothetical protein